MKKYIKITDILYWIAFICFVVFATYILYDRVLKKPSSTQTQETENDKYFVVRVIDGDTFVSEYYGNEYKIRLSKLDAPEIEQVYGKESKQFLSGLILNKYVNISDEKTGKYGRIIAEVYCDNTFINAQLIKHGCAWIYLSKDSQLLEYENYARDNKLGLWRSPNPQPPWEWRKNK